MKRKHIRIIARIFIGIMLLPFIVGLSVSEISYSIIPLWTQKPTFSCFPSDAPIEPVPAFLYGLNQKIER